MTLRDRLIELEILTALRIAAFGQWWAAYAARRSGKFSGGKSGEVSGADPEGAE